MTLDRNIAPAIQPIQQVDLLALTADKLRNGIPFYELKGGKQPVIHLQLIYPAGRWNENKELQSFFTGNQLLEGTTSKTSKEISELIDLHGSSISASPGYDVATIELLCLSKHLTPMIELLREVITSPVYDEKELALKQQIVKRSLQVNLQKTDVVAQRTFHEKVFGNNYPYGYASSIEKYDAITTEDLREFHQSNYLNATPIAILSGNYTSTELTQIQEMISGLPTGETQSPSNWTLNTESGATYIPFEEAKQTSIRIGKPIIDLKEEDFGKLTVANAILGGYFGSRLMSNLREEKGLTYGAYAQLGRFVNQVYWFIGTDVGKEHRELAVAEIKKEIKRLQDELVSDDELELVRNYVMGKFLGKVDGPFAQAKVYKSLLLNSQNDVDFQKTVQQILSTTATDIQRLVKQHWALDEMVEVMVG